MTPQCHSSSGTGFCGPGLGHAAGAPHPPPTKSSAPQASPVSAVPCPGSPGGRRRGSQGPTMVSLSSQLEKGDSCRSLQLLGHPSPCAGWGEQPQPGAEQGGSVPARAGRGQAALGEAGQPGAGLAAKAQDRQLQLCTLPAHAFAGHRPCDVHPAELRVWVQRRAPRLSPGKQERCRRGGDSLMAGLGCPVRWPFVPGFALPFLCRDKLPFFQLPKWPSGTCPCRQSGDHLHPGLLWGRQDPLRRVGSGLGTRAWQPGSLGQRQPRGDSPLLQQALVPPRRGEGCCG